MEKETIKVELEDKGKISIQMYYKMKYIKNNLDKNYEIKKRGDRIILKNNREKEIISEEYLREKIMQKCKKKMIKEELYELVLEKVTKELRHEILLMLFLVNTLENGWSIKKSEDSYIFSKRHENKKEVYSDDYLVSFLRKNFSNECEVK